MQQPFQFSTYYLPDSRVFLHYLAGLIIFLISVSATAQSVVSQPFSTPPDSLLTQLKSAQAAKNYPLIGESYINLARYYNRADDLRASMAYLNKALEVAEKHNIELVQATALLKLGADYFSLGLYEKALAYSFTALHLFEKINDANGIANSYNGIGRVYQYTDDLPSALINFKKSLEINTANSDEVGVMANILNIGVVFQKDGQFDSALVYFRKVLPIAQRLDKQAEVAKLYGNIGSTNMQMGNYPTALEYLERARDLKIKLGAERSLLHTLNDLAQLHLLMNQPEQTVSYTQKVITQAQEQEEGNQLRYGYFFLSKGYKQLGRFEEAYEAFVKYEAVKDSLFGLAQAKQMNQLEVQFETEKKDQAIASLQQEQEISELRTKGYLLLAAILLLGSGLLYYNQRLKTKKNQQLLAKEKEIDRLKSSFFANISHEFRTPLTLILGPLDSLQASNLGSRQQQQLGLMKENALRLLRLINQILDLSKLEEGHLKLNTQACDALTLVKGVVGSFNSLAESQNIKLSVNTDGSIPPVYCDPSHLETIVINIVGNAVKFSENGGNIAVHLKTRELSNEQFPEGSLEISVRDTGPGIAADQLQKIFDRYYQAGHSRKSFFGGTGIGLALTKQLVELHQGKISVQSEVGKGTEVTVTLPLGTAWLLNNKNIEVRPQPEQRQNFLTEPLEILSAENVAEESEEMDTKLPMLLLIEDNADVRAYIRSILEDEYRLLEAPDGVSGVEAAFEATPDIIISDVMMPGMNGYELCQRLKTDERTSHIPIVLLTARTSVDSRLEGLESQADIYLGKPFVPDELRLSLHNILQSRRKLQKRYRRQSILQPAELEVSSVDEAFLLKLKTVLNKHYAEESFSVEQLSREIGLSRSQLHRKLEALTSESTSLFIRNYRLQIAMDLLQKKHASVSEIAYKVGFSSPSYFTRCFVKKYGVNPSAILEK